MNDTATPPAAPKSSRKFFLPVVVAILAIGAIGYVASKAGLDKALVKEAVDDFAANLQSSSHDTLSLTYKDIRIEGGFGDRHAVIVEPQLKQSPEALESEEMVIYTTDAVLLYPHSSDLSTLKLVLPHPIRGYRGVDTSVEPSITVTQRLPIEVTAETETINGKSFVVSHIALPDSLLIDGRPSERDKPWNQMTMNMKPGATIVNSHTNSPNAPEGLGRTEINLEDVVITPQHDPADAITIKKFVTRYNNTQDKNGGSHVEVTADVGPVTGNEKTIPYAPMEFTMQLGYEGLLSSAPEDFASDTGKEKSLKIETLNLKMKDAAIYATADFVSGAKDILPVGTANLTVENVPFLLGEWRASTLWSKDKETILDAAIALVTGKKLAESKDISIDIKRVRDGAFQIGHTTFEELMALVLRVSLGGHMPVVTPELEAPQPETVPQTEEEAPELEEESAPAPQAPSDKEVF